MSQDKKDGCLHCGEPLAHRMADTCSLACAAAYEAATANWPLSPSEAEFFIQDTRSYDGAAVMWWCPNGQGYTSNLDKAGRFPESFALAQARQRTTDIAVPVEVARTIGHKTTRVSAHDLGLALQTLEKGEAKP